MASCTLWSQGLNAGLWSLPCHSLSDTKLILQHCHVKLFVCWAVQTQQKTCNRHGRMMESAIKKVQKLATKTSRWPRWRYPRCQAQASCCTRANLDLQGYKCNKASNDPQVVDRRQHFPRCEPSAVWLSCQLQRIAKCVSLSKSGRHLDFCSPQGKSRLSHL